MGHPRYPTPTYPTTGDMRATRYKRGIPREHTHLPTSGKYGPATGFAQVSAQKRGANLGHTEEPAVLLYLRGAQGRGCWNFDGTELGSQGRPVPALWRPPFRGEQ